MSHLLLVLALGPTITPTPESVTLHVADANDVRVYVMPEGVTDIGDRPSVLGGVSKLDSGVRFKPRFGFEPGVRYRIVYTLPGSDKPAGRDFTLPKGEPAEPPRLTAVYPTADEIPANVLKVYLNFSVPMRQGDSYRHIRLLGPDGKAVELPFLELPEELWDESGKRLTLYIDPGRIKREVKPRVDLGPVLVPGSRYALEIDGKWESAGGEPIGESYRKKFTAVEPLRDAHDPKHWKLAVPKAGTRSPLRVTFTRPMDHALAARMIRASIPGTVKLGKGETLWEFTPAKPWSAGGHELTINTALEDIAGNRIDAAFEVDVFEKVDKTVKSKFIKLPFTIEKK